MAKRFVSIWFRHLTTDWVVRRQPELKDIAFVLAAPERGRMLVKAVSAAAQLKGIETGMVVADVRAIFPALRVLDDQPGMTDKLLKALAEWCLRYAPVAAVDLPEGLILDISGCPHLWGGESPYLKDMVTRLSNYGYHVRAAIADTVGAAWAIARFGKTAAIIESGKHAAALMPMPPGALRLEPEILVRMDKLGLRSIQSFIDMPRSVLRRRFGQALLTRLAQALGEETEPLQPVQPVVPYQERLPSMDPIKTLKGIETGLRRLLEALCSRLLQEGKGLRKGIFKCYRTDHNIQQIEIGTNRPSRNVEHLLKLFALRFGTIEPRLGFELFVLDAPVVEDISIEQEVLWNNLNNNDVEVADLLDRIAAKIGAGAIHRYLPAEHYWPERSMREAASMDEQPAISWRNGQQRPVHLLLNPEPIEVTVPIPDYPPMLFIHKGQLHKVSKADGPERIEREWWLDDGPSRDYYCLEDEAGARYWIFRSGRYDTGEPQWFMHGFFA